MRKTNRGSFGRVPPAGRSTRPGNWNYGFDLPGLLAARRGQGYEPIRSSFRNPSREEKPATTDNAPSSFSTDPRTELREQSFQMCHHTLLDRRDLKPRRPDVTGRRRTRSRSGHHRFRIAWRDA